MILLVLRVLAGLALLLGAAAGAAFLIDSGGGVQIDLLGRSYPRLTLVEALLALAVVFAALWLVWSVARFLADVLRFALGDDAALTRKRARARARRGLEALSAGRVALGEGDPSAADRHARRAHRLLGDQPLTLLLDADVAEALGDEARAEAAFRALARRRDTAALGCRRLMGQAERRGEAERALKLAAHVAALRPRDAETRRTLLRLQAAAGAWAEAAAIVSDMAEKKLAPPDETRRLAALVEVEAARAAEAAGDRAEAARRADAAVKAAPDFAPAVALAARLQAAGGEVMRATRALRDAWRAEPRPEIAEAFAAIAPDETPAARRERFRDLLRGAPERPESRLLEAETALLAGAPAAARAALAAAGDQPPSRRAALLGYALARAEGAPEPAAQALLAEALAAPDDPGWTCAGCGAAPGVWRLACPNCGALDALTWRDAPGVSRPPPETTRRLVLEISDEAPSAAPARLSAAMGA